MIYIEIENREDLMIWLLAKLDEKMIDDTPENRLQFLIAESFVLKETSSGFDPDCFRVKQLIDSEISVLRVRQHIDPTLF